METKKCPKCNSDINTIAKYCPRCGYNFEKSEKEMVINKKSKSKKYVIIAIVVVLILSLGTALYFCLFHGSSMSDSQISVMLTDIEDNYEMNSEERIKASNSKIEEYEDAAIADATLSSLVKKYINGCQLQNSNVYQSESWNEGQIIKAQALLEISKDYDILSDSNIASVLASYFLQQIYKAPGDPNIEIFDSDDAYKFELKVKNDSGYDVDVFIIEGTVGDLPFTGRTVNMSNSKEQTITCMIDKNVVREKRNGATEIHMFTKYVEYDGKAFDCEGGGCAATSSKQVDEFLNDINN